MQLLSGNKMEKSNYKEWSVDFNGKIIKVSNWWNWEGKGSADLYLDNEAVKPNIFLQISILLIQTRNTMSFIPWKFFII